MQSGGFVPLLSRKVQSIVGQKCKEWEKKTLKQGSEYDQSRTSDSNLLATPCPRPQSLPDRRYRLSGTHLEWT